MRRSRGGQGARTPTSENYKAIGLLSNTGPDLLENQKAIKPTFNVGSLLAHQFAGGPIMTSF